MKRERLVQFRIRVGVPSKRASTEYDAIRLLTHHSSTILHGEGGFEGEGQAVVYSVINTNDKARVVKAVRDVDEHAFVDVIRTEEIEGNFYIAPHE